MSAASSPSPDTDMPEMPAMPRRVLIACVGNIFLGDDGCGVAVAERLRGRSYPPGVHVVDFGIRGFELAYTLLDGYETLVLVDAAPPGGSPGSLYLMEIDAATAPSGAPDAHSMDPVKVLAFASELGAQPQRILLVGCEPAQLACAGHDEMRMELSEPVRAAVDEAVGMIDRLIGDLCSVGTRVPT